MLPTIRGFSDIVRDMSAAITASAGKLIDVSIGSVLRAIIDANAGLVLWVQSLVLITLQMTRAATSNGTDLDTWMADFGVTRLPALPASGTASFSRFSGNVQTVVPAGTTMKTRDGLIKFIVSADPAHPAWQKSQNGYSLPIGVMSIDLPIKAAAPGSTGNVMSGAISLLASPVPGMDRVNNTLATTGGYDSESDDNFRNRFANFLTTRSRATVRSIEYAISQVGPLLHYLILENVTSTGGVRMGHIRIVVDDGSGTIPAALLESLFAAVEPVRPIGTSFSIEPPNVVSVGVSLSVQSPAGFAEHTSQIQLMSAISTYINQLPIGQTLSLTRISQISYDAVPEIINISNVLLNGSDHDLISAATTSFKFGNIHFA